MKYKKEKRIEIEIISVICYKYLEIELWYFHTLKKN